MNDLIRLGGGENLVDSKLGQLYMTHLLILLFNKSIIFKTLVTEALMTCNKLKQKLKIIKMFCDNSYPLDIVQSSINPKIIVL